MNLFKKQKVPTKHQTLKHFIETADMNCISHYYSDSFFSSTPKPLLQKYINELSQDGYVKPYIRGVLLLPKSYSYIYDYRMELFFKVLSTLGRPISHLVSWSLGIASAVIVQYIIEVLKFQP